MSNHSFLLTKPTPHLQIDINKSTSSHFLHPNITTFVSVCVREREAMKELRFVALPFSVGCVSQSSVAVIEHRTKRAVQAADTAASAAALTLPSAEDGGQSVAKPRSASLSGTPLSSFSRPNVAAGFHRLIRGFRSLSQQLLVYTEDEDEEEMEMVIGFPTDVQHVGHVGCDGFDGMAGATAMKSCWEKAAAGAPEFLPLPSCSFSLQQFELDVAAAPAQAGVSQPPCGGPMAMGVCPQ